MASQTSYASIVIATDDDLSTAVDCRGLIPLGIQCPATITSASITFKASALDSAHPDVPFTTYGSLYNKNGEVSYAVAANRFIALDPADFAGVASFKIATASGEAANRKFAVIMRHDA